MDWTDYFPFLNNFLAYILNITKKPNIGIWSVH